MRTTTLDYDSETSLWISVISAFTSHSCRNWWRRRVGGILGWWFSLPKLLFSERAQVFILVLLAPDYTFSQCVLLHTWFLLEETNHQAPRANFCNTNWPVAVYATLMSSVHHLCVHSGYSGAGFSPLKNGRLWLTLFTGLSQSWNRKPPEAGLWIMPETIIS